MSRGVPSMPSTPKVDLNHIRSVSIKVMNTLGTSNTSPISSARRSKRGSRGVSSRPRAWTSAMRSASSVGMGASFMDMLLRGLVPRAGGVTSNRCSGLPARQQVAIAGNVKAIDGTAVPDEQVEVVESAAGGHCAGGVVAPAPGRGAVLDDDHPAVVTVGRGQLDLRRPGEGGVVEAEGDPVLEHLVYAVGCDPGAEPAGW